MLELQRQLDLTNSIDFPRQQCSDARQPTSPDRTASRKPRRSLAYICRRSRQPAEWGLVQTFCSKTVLFPVREKDSGAGVALFAVLPADGNMRVAVVVVDAARAMVQRRVTVPGTDTESPALARHGATSCFYCFLLIDLSPLFRCRMRVIALQALAE